MFTGIIESIGTVSSVERSSSVCRLRISNPWSDVAVGESIAVNGVCLTSLDGSLLFDVSPETLRCTSLGALAAGDSVNLERSLRLGDRVSGHLVQGHVDGLGRLLSVEPKEDGSLELTVGVPEPLRRYMSPKGSVAIDGISLTINSVESDRISLMIIPHTWKATNLSTKRVGQDLNLEADVIAKTLYEFYRRSH